jgi:sugar transferase (PEP-CTERM/EpsH1 system associated)
MFGALDRLCLMTQFDSVIAFSSSMAPYALHVPASRRILDLCDLDSRKWLDYADASMGPVRSLYRMEGQRLAQREQEWAKQCNATILISEAEAAPLVQRTSSAHVYHIGNGVNLPAQRLPTSNEHPIVGFVGMMNYRPNVDAVCWFADHCWADLRQILPSAEVRIVGRSPTRKVRSLDSRSGITVVGAVDDLASELRQMDVSVAPMRIARGLQNKVLEAMADSIPVVLTSAAAEGIAGQHDRDFLKADSPTAMTRSILDLLRNPAERMRIGDAGRRFVARYHRWPEVLREFELVVTGAVNRTAAVSGVQSSGDSHTETITHSSIKA